MRIFDRGHGILTACLVLLAASFAHGEEIYKWVDKDGRTHYSARKEEAGDARTTSLAVDAPPPSAPAPAAMDADRMRAQADTPAPRLIAPTPRPQATTPPVNYRDESPAAKCRLAKDILSGAARHSSGAPVDAYDRQVAQNDVRTFCGH